MTDSDPYGIDIMAVYRFGSLSMACSGERLAVPSLLWLGMFPTDIRQLQIPHDRLRPLSDCDHKRLQDLAKRSYFKHNSQFLEQLDELFLLDRKAEIQHISDQPGFLSQVYLPGKIISCDWM